MRRPLAFAEQCFAALTLMLYSGGPFNVILSGGWSQGDTRIATPDFALTRSLFFLTYAISFLLLVLRWKKVAYVIARDKVIWCVLALILASIVWSAAPEVSLTESIGLLGTTFFGIYFATRYTPKQQLQVLGWSFAFVIGLSLLYGLVLPRYGVMGGVHAGSWRGIYTHKNTLGKMMTLSSSIFLLLMLQSRKYRPFLGLGLGLSFMLLLLSTSKGALVNILLLVIAIIVCQILRFNYRWLVILLSAITIAGGAIAVWVAANFETLVVGVLGKDLTFTGRTTLWTSIFEVVQKQPWLGYGYRAFWNGWDSPAAYVWNKEGWTAPDAHNGFIDVYAQLGLIGLSIFLAGYFYISFKALLQFRRTHRVELIWPILFLIFMILSNMAESSLLKNDIFWVLYVTITLSMILSFEKGFYFLQKSSSSSDEEALVHTSVGHVVANE